MAARDNAGVITQSTTRARQAALLARAGPAGTTLAGHAPIAHRRLPRLALHRRLHPVVERAAEPAAVTAAGEVVSMARRNDWFKLLSTKASTREIADRFAWVLGGAVVI